MKVIKENHFGIARKIVSNMTSESWETIPHAVITYETEIDKFLAVLKEINKDIEKEDKITVNTAMLRIIIEAIKACPVINSHLEFNRRLVRGNLKTMENIDVSMPVILKNGEMMTLNIHGLENKTITGIRDAVKDSLRRANNSDMNEVMYEVSLDNTLQGLKKGKILQAINRLIGSKTGKHKVKTLSGKAKKEYYAIPETERLTKHDIEQGTITISNLGSIYREWDGKCAMLEIIPPQITAIAIGAGKKEPVVKQDGTIGVATKLALTIAFDHRALDLGDVVPFMRKLDEIFANPKVLKDWM